MGVEFVLEYLDVSATLAESVQQTASSATLDGSANAQIDLAASALNSLFIFQTDASDVTEEIADDIKYAVNDADSNWPSVDVLAYSNAVVTSGGVHTLVDPSNTIAFDLVRSHVKDVFGFAGATDLISNETAMRNAVAAKNATIRTNIVTLLDTEASSGSASQPVTNDKSAADGNVVRALIEQLANNEAGNKRLTTGGSNGSGSNSMVAPDNKLGGGGAGADFFKFMFIPGDTLKIKVTYNPLSETPINQLGTVQTRSYAIVLNLTA